MEKDDIIKITTAVAQSLDSMNFRNKEGTIETTLNEMVKRIVSNKISNPYIRVVVPIGAMMLYPYAVSLTKKASSWTFGKAVNIGKSIYYKCQKKDAKMIEKTAVVPQISEMIKMNVLYDAVYWRLS